VDRSAAATDARFDRVIEQVRGNHRRIDRARGTLPPPRDSRRFELATSP
jgi:hypothetical protein